jgi:hypothetical protein
MTVNLEWSQPHEIISPYGTLRLNTPDTPLTSGKLPLYLIQPPYAIVPANYRAISDNLSQADGSSLQPPFVSGLVASLRVQFWTLLTEGGDREKACDGDLREMDQRLTLHLNALRDCSADPNTLQRLLWTPEGYGDDRMLIWVFLSAWLAPDFAESPIVEVAFSLATPYPYAIDATEIQTMIADGASAAIVNSGSAAQSPVIRVYGPSSTFAITNITTGEALSYDSSRPGGIAIGSSEYAEIDFFHCSIFLNGNGADLVAGLDPTITTYFKLAPGSQTIATNGADITVLSNNTVL